MDSLRSDKELIRKNRKQQNITMEIVMEQNEFGDGAQCSRHSTEIQLAIVGQYADHSKTDPC